MKFLSLAAFLAGILGASAAPLANIPFQSMDGKTASLSDYAGKVVLVVNVASRCGNTPQYAGLENLYKKFGPEDFVVLGFPCNDFGAQEPGNNAEIRAFCASKYAVTFPLFDKLHVKGPDQAPLYAALTGPEAAFPGDVQWNFGKFLIGKDGMVRARFAPKTKPEEPVVVAEIEKALE